MRLSCRLLLIGSLAAAAGCLGPGADLEAPFTGQVGPVHSTDRTVLAEFTIRFDAYGGTVEVTAPDPTGIPAEATRLMNATGRLVAPSGDVLFDTLSAYYDPALGTCGAGDWGFEVQVTNDGDVTWHSPIAQLFEILRIGVAIHFR